jgi:hypothetical protein
MMKMTQDQGQHQTLCSGVGLAICYKYAKYFIQTRKTDIFLKCGNMDNNITHLFYFI